MKMLRPLAASLILSLGVTALTPADPLDPRQIPADAKWVIHADMDAARDTKLWAAMDNELSTNADFQNGIGKIEQITGAQFPRDLHDVTLYGRSADDQAGVVIVHAHVNRQQIVTLLQMNTAFASNAYGDYQVLTWHDDDKNKTMFGSFKDDSTMIISQTEDLVKGALDVMDDKAEHIKVDSPLAAGAKPQLLAFIAASDLRRWKQAELFQLMGDVRQIKGATLYDFYKAFRKASGAGRKRQPRKRTTASGKAG